MSAEPTFGRYAEIPLDQMKPQQRQGYDDVVESRGEALGPYKIFVQHSALVEREIAVNLVNGHWQAAYPNHRHEIFGKQAGLTPDKVEARQQVIYDLTLTLIGRRVVPTGL